MVREARYRVKKWDKKIDPSIVMDRFSKLKDVSLEQLEPYLIQVTGMEKRVKEFLEKVGVSTIEIAFYLAYMRELIGKTFGSLTEETLRNEELAIRQKWVSRGLRDEYLKEIAKMFGIEPKHIPTPIELFRIINDLETSEDLTKIELYNPPGVSFYLSSERAYTGEHSLKFDGLLDWIEEPVKIKTNVNLMPFKRIGFKLSTDIFLELRVVFNGYDEHDNLLFSYTKEYGNSELANTFIDISLSRSEVSDWDLAKKIEFVIYGTFYGPVYIDTIHGRLV